MGLIRALFTIALSLLLLSSPVLANLCLTIEISAKGTSHNYCLDESDISHDEHSHDEDSSCADKTSCPIKHTCCVSAIEGKISYLSILDSYPLDFAEILFQPLEITESLYRPPRINLL